MSAVWWEPYAWTDRQRRIMQLHEDGFSSTQIAAELKITDGSTVRRDIRTIKRRAAEKAQGPSYLQHTPVADAEIVKGTSTLYDAEGKPKLQWVKTRTDELSINEIIEAAKEKLGQELPPRSPVPPPGLSSPELCVVYPMTDAHIGLLSRVESPMDSEWNLEQSARLLKRWIDVSIDHSPQADTAVVAFIGDIAHYDKQKPVTNRSGHVLEASGTPLEMIAQSFGVIEYATVRALEKHDFVHLIIKRGNHDEHTMMVFMVAFQRLFAHEPRVKVDFTESLYTPLEFGSEMLVFTHGHGNKKEAVPLQMAAEHREMWGRTKHTTVFSGHYHHRVEQDFPGATIVQLRTLAARSRYDKDNGYVSPRDGSVFVFHRQRGEVGRQIWPADCLS